MLTGEMLRRSAARFPQRAAILCGDERVSYAELDRDANRFARALHAMGLGRGAKVGIMSRNLPPYGTVFFGAARSGAVLVNVSVRYAPDELAYVLANAEVELLVVEPAFRDAVEALRPRLPKLRQMVSLGPEFAALLAEQSPEPPPVAPAETDPFCMTYTGGTTGFPKGVLCDHRARDTTAHTVVIEEHLEDTDVVAIVTPLFHVAALNIMFQPAVLIGATCVFLPAWSVDAFTDMVERFQVSAAFMVPVQAAQLVARELDPPRFRTWRKLSFAGAPMPDQVQLELMRQLPELRLTQIYGQSEMGVLTALPARFARAKLGSVGRPAYNVDVAVMKPDGSPCRPGEIGEVVSRGANLMRAYYAKPEETAAFFRQGDGWGWSGDLGYLDAEGFLYLVDRSKDMIISGGENVYPKEIEEVIYQLDAVAECAVFGVPDEEWGELPAAYVILKQGHAATAEAIVEHCARKLARFKRPRLVEFVADLPRTAIGKVQKGILKEPYWQGREKKI